MVLCNKQILNSSLVLAQALWILLIVFRLLSMAGVFRLFDGQVMIHLQGTTFPEYKESYI